jgi:recombination protein RecR
MDILLRLVEALRCLPGVGPKSAQRMVFHLLQHQRERGLHLAECLTEAMSSITHCDICNNYTCQPICDLCQATDRDTRTLCVVESPADVVALEQCMLFRGRYFVLMGKISPLDGIGPNEIGLPRLRAYVEQAQIQEVILALSPSIEGRSTVHFIQEQLKPLAITISQLAHGIPSGGELALLDGNTIGSAFRNRECIL